MLDDVRLLLESVGDVCSKHWLVSKGFVSRQKSNGRHHDSGARLSGARRVDRCWLLVAGCLVGEAWRAVGVPSCTAEGEVIASPVGGRPLSGAGGGRCKAKQRNSAWCTELVGTFTC